MASIKDVAKMANVSIATVSRAFNGYSDINAQTKERIFAIAQELQYSPNVIAKSLSSKKTNNIAIILSGLQQSDGRDNIIHNILKGVYNVAAKHKIETTLYNVDKSVQEHTSLTKFCQDRHIAGVIIQGIRMDDPYFRELVDSRVPCVIIDVHPGSGQIGAVSSDNIKAAQEIADYVLSNNHQHIAILAGLQEAVVTIERMTGFFQAFATHQRPIEMSSVFYADYREDLAFRKTIELIKTHPQTTAIICMSDLMAINAMRAIQSLGLKVPEDISVTGFDDIPLCTYVSPPLTTIRQDFYKIATTAAELLLDLLAKKQDIQYQQVVPHTFIERQSVKTLVERE